MFLETGPPPPYLRVWMRALPSLPLSQGLDLELLGSKQAQCLQMTDYRRVSSRAEYKLST